MLIDGRNFASDSELTTTVCIVGSGPAGLTLARELNTRMDVILLESGDSSNDPTAQSLNDGQIVAEGYVGLRQTRRRQLGGAVNAWNTPVADQIGAKYVRLDPWDLSTPPGNGVPGWPIAHADLGTYYDRADALCGISSSRPGETLRTATPPFHLTVSPLRSGLYHFGPAEQFLRVHAGVLSLAANVRLHTNTTVLGLTAGSTRRITQLLAKTASGGTVRVNARVFVLAAGAIENARLLMLSRATASGLLDDRHGWLGRCFMEHPRDTALSLIPHSADLFRLASFYDTHTSPDGSISGGRIGLSDGELHARGIPNMSITLLPRERSRGKLAAWSLRLGLSGSRGGYGWSALEEPWRYFDGFNVLVNLEQRPRRDNYLALSGERDRLGQPRSMLKWSWTAREQSDLQRLRVLISTEFENSRLGRVHVDERKVPDPNAHHHAGTTRMSERAEFGVVDPDARVHGIDNLYVTGASIFPTSGFANPTLTIVALASRLAVHLAERL